MILMLLLTFRTFPYTVSLAGRMLPYPLVSTQNATPYTHIHNLQAKYLCMSCQPFQKSSLTPSSSAVLLFLRTLKVPCALQMLYHTIVLSYL